MGVIVNKENTKKSDLTRRIDADLKAKQAATTKIDGDADPDFAEDTEYVKNMKKTSKFGWVWIVLIVLAILSIIIIAFL